MSSYTPIALGNGKFCYSGPACRRHSLKPKGFQNVKDVFSRIDQLFPSKIEVTDASNFSDFSSLCKEYQNTLEDNEATALHVYADNNGSSQINSALSRRGDVLPHLRWIVRNLDSGIAKFPTSEVRELFRGSKHVPEGWDNLQTGDEVEVKNFHSTSSSPNIAMRFAKENRPAHPFLIRILTKEGAPVLSHQNVEYEFLIPRNQRYEVVSFIKNKDFVVKTSNSASSTYKGVNILTLRAI